MFYASTKCLSKPLQEQKPYALQRALPSRKKKFCLTQIWGQYINAMGKKEKDYEKNNPFVLTAINKRVIIMRKDSPNYEAKKNDRILSIDCVLANSDRLTEIQRGIFELDAWLGIFYFSCRGLLCFGLCSQTYFAPNPTGKSLILSHLWKWHGNRGAILGNPLIANDLTPKKKQLFY